MKNKNSRNTTSIFCLGKFWKNYKSKATTLNEIKLTMIPSKQNIYRYGSLNHDIYINNEDVVMLSSDEI